MISVKEATSQILDHHAHFGTEVLPLRESYGRVLAEDLLADRDFPPLTRVAMDGIAIAFEAFERGRRTFPIEDVLPAGAPQKALASPENCLEVMTGAILPTGADTVIRYEDLEIDGRQATIRTENVWKGQNAHPRGKDRSQGDRIVPAGRVLGPGEIGVAATVGKNRLKVRRLPNVLVVYTGDELVAIDKAPLPHQIRVSNAFTIDALLADWNIHAELLHLNDTRENIHARLRDSLEEYDLILLSGGISKGKFDFVPSVLEELGVQRKFHKVQQRPGKPFWFGYTEHTTVFAFPGNPVSAFMCACRYLVPWLRQNLGLMAFENEFSLLSEAFYNKAPLTYFLPVRLQSAPDGRLLATPQLGHGSGDLANLSDADGFLELPPGPKTIEAGAAFPLIRYRRR